MNLRCNGCGRGDVATYAFRCIWPDGRMTLDRYCDSCRLTWTRQLKSLGAKLEAIDGEPSPKLQID